MLRLNAGSVAVLMLALAVPAMAGEATYNAPTTFCVAEQGATRYYSTSMLANRPPQELAAMKAAFAKFLAEKYSIHASPECREIRPLDFNKEDQGWRAQGKQVITTGWRMSSPPAPATNTAANNQPAAAAPAAPASPKTQRAFCMAWVPSQPNGRIDTFARTPAMVMNNWDDTVVQRWNRFVGVKFKAASPNGICEPVNGEDRQLLSYIESKDRQAQAAQQKIIITDFANAPYLVETTSLAANPLIGAAATSAYSAASAPKPAPAAPSPLPSASAAAAAPKPAVAPAPPAAAPPAAANAAPVPAGPENPILCTTQIITSNEPGKRAGVFVRSGVFLSRMPPGALSKSWDAYIQANYHTAVRTGLCAALPKDAALQRNMISQQEKVAQMRKMEVSVVDWTPDAATNAPAPKPAPAASASPKPATASAALSQPQRAEAAAESSSATFALSVLSVASTPPGAKVLLDGADMGATPASFQVDPGDHTLQVEKAGFAPSKQKVVVKPGNSIDLEVELNPR